MEKRYMLYVFLAVGLFAAACGGTDSTSSSAAQGANDCESECCGDFCGTGGSGNGSSSVSTGGSGSSASTSSGGSNVCHPTFENNWCATQLSCECAPTEGTSPEWCAEAEGFNFQLCPEGMDVCSPGHNQCGYNLPPGQDYEMPACRDFISGDTWIADNGNESNIYSDFTENGQLISAGNGAPPDYFTHYTISGNKWFWNRKNAGAYESAEGEFSPDCKTVTIRYYKAGKAAPYGEKSIFWYHE